MHPATTDPTLQAQWTCDVIVLNLSCENEHLFEGWFASANAFESQREKSMVACPTCGNTHVTRRPTAPYVSTASTRDSDVTRHRAVSPSPEAMARLVETLREAARSSDDVGERFPEEARRIHYGEIEARNIRGQASGDDIGELLEEGILVLPVPPDEGTLQ